MEENRKYNGAKEMYFGKKHPELKHDEMMPYHGENVLVWDFKEGSIGGELEIINGRKDVYILERNPGEKSKKQKLSFSNMRGAIVPLYESY